MAKIGFSLTSGTSFATDYLVIRWRLVFLVLALAFGMGPLLFSASANLNITTNPTGATIIVDEQQQWIAPINMELNPGVHHLKITLKGYQEKELSIDMSAGETKNLDLALVAQAPQEAVPGSAILRVDSEPLGATIVVDGNQQWIAPIEMDLSPGRHLLRFELQGYETQVRSFQLEPGSRQETKVVLKPLADKRKIAFLVLAVFSIVVLSLLAARKWKAGLDVRKDELAMNDTPTAELRFDTLAQTPSRTPTPLDGEAIAAIRSKTRELPDGVIHEIGGYELMGMLGRGGMGTTFMAKRKRDGLPVAIKVPHDHLLDNDQFVQRFLREGKLGTTLHHPHIIRILEAGQDGKKLFIAMELLHGETLETMLDRRGRLPLNYSLEISRAIAVALDYARLKGIVHRDLKPENIMILEGGGLKVMDFGIARILDSPGITSSEAYLGTPSYSAPESVGQGPVDQRADLYSLGIILYRMLAGALPFYSKNPLEILEMHRSLTLPPFDSKLEIPASVFHLVEKLTAKTKEGRYANAEEYLVELNTVSNQLQHQPHRQLASF